MILTIIIINAIKIYRPPIKGTINSAAEPILFIPPRTTIPVKTTNITAVTVVFILNELLTASAIEFDWTPGNNTPIAITVTIANNRPYAFANVVSPKPFSM